MDDTTEVVEHDVESSESIDDTLLDGIDSSITKQEMIGLIDKYFPIKLLRKNDIVDGAVVEKLDTEQEIVVSIGYKSEGIVPFSEAKSLGEKGLQELKSEQSVVAMVVAYEDNQGRPVLSIDKARGEQGWRILEKALENSETASGVITSSNRGGAIVDVNGIQGFIPVSQLVGQARELYQPDSQDYKEGFIGLEIEFKILELNRRRNRAIFSERLAMQEKKKAQKIKIINSLEVGSIHEGTVVGISNFGIFVDIGGADGLVHISELSWDPVKSPADMVNVGDKINAYILSIDKDISRIALSIKRLQSHPWLSVDEKFKVGEIVKGGVTKITDFGAFVRIASGVEGLIHISEFSNETVTHPKEFVQEGQELEVRIVRIDAEKHRIGLSLKQVKEPENKQTE